MRNLIPPRFSARGDRLVPLQVVQVTCCDFVRSWTWSQAGGADFLQRISFDRVINNR